MSNGVANRGSLARHPAGELGERADFCVPLPPVHESYPPSLTVLPVHVIPFYSRPRAMSAEYRPPLSTTFSISSRRGPPLPPYASPEQFPWRFKLISPLPCSPRIGHTRVQFFMGLFNGALLKYADALRRVCIHKSTLYYSIVTRNSEMLLIK